MAHSARTLKAIDAKADEVLEIARVVAELHSTTNNALLSGLSNVTEKWRQDEKTASISLKWAVGGIFISAVFAFIAVAQDFYTNKSNDKQQQETKLLLEEQIRLTKDGSREQNGRTLELERRVHELETMLSRKPSPGKVKRTQKVGPHHQ